MDYWNIQSNIWLRRIAYVRLPKFKTLGVCVLSAFWHGMYPGYYFTFVFLAFVVIAGRKIRHNIRPFFLKNSLTKAIYAVISWFCTLFVINYISTPFILLHYDASIQFYR